MGHALNHNFDNYGILWNSLGGLQTWLTPASLATFDKFAKCVVDQYDAFEVLPKKYTPYKVNGHATEHENIANAAGRLFLWMQKNGNIFCTRLQVFKPPIAPTNLTSRLTDPTHNYPIVYTRNSLTISCSFSVLHSNSVKKPPTSNSFGSWLARPSHRHVTSCRVHCRISPHSARHSTVRQRASTRPRIIAECGIRLLFISLLFHIFFRIHTHNTIQ